MTTTEPLKSSVQKLQASPDDNRRMPSFPNICVEVEEVLLYNKHSMDIPLSSVQNKSPQTAFKNDSDSLIKDI